MLGLLWFLPPVPSLLSHLVVSVHLSLPAMVLLTFRLSAFYSLWTGDPRASSVTEMRVDGGGGSGDRGKDRLVRAFSHRLWSPFYPPRGLCFLLAYQVRELVIILQNKTRNKPRTVFGPSLPSR